MRTSVTGGFAAVMIAVAAAGCGGSGTSRAVDATTTTTTTTTKQATDTSAIENTWAAKRVDRTRLPIGTDHVTTTTPAVGGLFVCDAGNPNGGGAFRVGSWIDETAGTWDATKKVAVQGKVAWPMAKYSEQVSGTTRTITSNGLPVGMVTGTFPIAANDPAFAYDRNPNSIAAADVMLTLPATPTTMAKPTCLPKASIGILKNGVVVFAPVDERNRDAVAYETQDQCDGHPQQSSTYHYHDIPSCVLAASKGASTVVGFARDGVPIVVERDGAGRLPTNADLDECHGRTSPVELDGKIVTTYHYSATYEFPYFMGCYRATHG